MDDNTGWWLDEYDGPRFWRLVARNGGSEHEADPLATATGECWTWTGSRDRFGYGRFRMGSKLQLAHRIAYLDGSRSSKIPDGWVIDHLCRNASCVNPTHLEAVPFRTNVERGARGRAARPTCPSGHRFTPENTAISVRRGREVRICKTCISEGAHRRYVAKKESARVGD